MLMIHVFSAIFSEAEDAPSRKALALEAAQPVGHAKVLRRRQHGLLLDEGFERGGFIADELWRRFNEKKHDGGVISLSKGCICARETRMAIERERGRRGRIKKRKQTIDSLGP